MSRSGALEMLHNKLQAFAKLQARKRKVEEKFALLLGFYLIKM
jgi:hypothetical protein